MDIFIENIKNSKQLNKRDLKYLTKGKELTIKLNKNEFRVDPSSPCKPFNLSGSNSIWQSGSKFTTADSQGSYA